MGNINQSVDVLLKTSHLFDPFPEAMAGDTAFFDRMHYYIPGWEVCDGTHWSVEILTDGRSIKKYGSNNYPLEWELFCRLIRQITNRKFQ